MKRSLALLLALALLLSVSAAAAPPAISSRGAVVLDYDTGAVLFSQNGDTLLTPASTTKLLTAYLVFQAIEEGLFTEDTVVPISDRAVSVASNWDLTNVPMERGGTYTVHDLISAMLVVSACGVCVSLAEMVSGSEEAFVRRMNDTMAELGLEGSFTDCYGLADDNQITPLSLALLSQMLIRRFPQVLDYTKQRAIKFGGHWYGCTNCLLPGCSAAYEGADGLKTGSTTAAGKCLVGTAQRDGKRVIVVLLGASNSSVRAQEMTALLDYGFAQLASGQPEQTPEGAASVTPDAEAAAWQLYELGLLKGQGTLPDGTPDLALEETLTRAEAVVLLLRLLAQEESAFLSEAQSPFNDVPGWAEPYVAYAWQNGLVAGVDSEHFAPDDDCDVRSYLTLCYRALGYDEGVHFQWAQALDFAAPLGLAAAGGLSETQTLTRGIAAQLTYGALSCLMEGGDQTLAQFLGLVSGPELAGDAA